MFKVLCTWWRPSPFQYILQHCLAFLIQSKQERKKKGLLGPESFSGSCLKNCPHCSDQAGPSKGSHLWPSSFHSHLAGGLPSTLPEGSSGYDSFWPCAFHMWGQYPHAHFIFLQHRSAARHQCWSYTRHKKTFVFLECLANRSASG